MSRLAAFSGPGSLSPNSQFLIPYGVFVFVNVHVTFAPPTSTMALAGLPSEHAPPESVQPGGSSSLTEYVPATSGPLSFDSPSRRTNELSRRSAIINAVFDVPDLFSVLV